MKVIFLDFDGPIIPFMSHQERRPFTKRGWPACIEQLNRITDTTGAKIVVSSTYRAGGSASCREMLKRWGATGEVIGITPHLRQDEESGPEPRGIEIQYWIDHQKGEPVESFTILDDDTDMEHLLDHLVLTPFESGLTRELADIAIAMLGA